MKGATKPKDAISQDFIAGDYMTMLEAKRSTPKRVAEMIAEACEGYEYAVIDTPVTIDTITLGVLLACDSVIIPTTADGGALKGIEALSGAIESAKKVNKSLRAIYVLFVRYDKRKVLDRQLKETFEQRTPYRCFKTAIRQANPIREAQTMQEPLLSARHSTAMRDYRAVLTEMEKGE
jgi:chromosome partitioning protein